VLEEFQLVSEVEELKPDLFKVTVSPVDDSKDITFRKYIRIPGMGGGCSSGGC
jgi:hypothetical protein